MHSFARFLLRFNKVKGAYKFDGKAVKTVPRSAGGLCLASGLAFAERKEGGNKPEKSVTFTDCPLTHQFVLRQSSVLSVEAVSRVLTQTVVALQEENASYCQKLRKLIDIYNLGGDGLPLVMTSQQHYEEMVSLKSQVNGDKKAVQELHLLFVYVQKLVDAAAETSFLVGADYASVQASERLHAAERQVKKVVCEREQLETELLRAEAGHVHRTNIKRDTKLNEEKPLNDDVLIKGKETLKKVDKAVFEEDIKISTTYEESMEDVKDKNKYFFDEHGGDDIKISVKDESDEKELASETESNFSDEEFNFPLHRKEFGDKKEEEYKMPTF